MRDYVTSEWDSIARANGLDSFDAVWALDIGWFEEPNKRRNGWSGVSRCEVDLPDADTVGVFIKRQQNHTTRSLLHPFRGVPTFRREFQNLMQLQAYGVPTLDILYFAERSIKGERRAILVSRELTGYASFGDCMAYWKKNGFPDKATWQKLIQKISGVARCMHRHRMQHNCFFPKHVFIGELDGQMDIRLIDFEKAKRTLRTESAMLRDLDTLNRRLPGIRTTDRLRFLLAYLEKERVDSKVRRVWRKLLALMNRKGNNLLRDQ